MKAIVLLCFILVLSFCIKIDNHRQENTSPIVGAYGVRDVNNLSDSMKEIDNFLKNTFPELQNFKLTKAQTQIVSGTNYRYTYTNETNNTSIEYTVWDEPWTNTR